MKKIIIFIFLTAFFSISLFLPSKVLALNCPDGISGQFLDENGDVFNFESGQGVGWFLTTNDVSDPSYQVKDHLLSGLSDQQGKFNISPTTNNSLNGSLRLTWSRKGYSSTEELILSQCKGFTVSLKLLEPNTNPRCGKPCETSSECAQATDECTSCLLSINTCVHPSWTNKSAHRLCSSQDCLDCIEKGGSWTALGCISTKSPSEFVKYLLNFAIGIGGGIALLLMIFGGLQIIFSGGNPDKVKAGKEIITAALGGLLLIIFSVFILRVIGYDILAIPGFEKY